MTAARQPFSDLPDWPRMLSADEAARYVGVSRNIFDAEVQAGVWPPGMMRGARNGKLTWDRKELDHRLDLRRQFGEPQNAPNPEDGFERRRREAAARREARSHKTR